MNCSNGVYMATLSVTNGITGYACVKCLGGLDAEVNRNQTWLDGQED